MSKKSKHTEVFADTFHEPPFVLSAQNVYLLREVHYALEGVAALMVDIPADHPVYDASKLSSLFSILHRQMHTALALEH